MTPDSSRREEVEAEILRLLAEASEEAREVVGQVIRLENEKLHQGRPQGLVDDIADNIRRVVQ